jgi:carbamoyltransferase
VQAVTTRAGVSLACAARALTGKTSLALAGGVALNGYLVEAVGRDAGFDRTFVPPAVNDGGIAAGAALFAAHHELGEPYRPPSEPLSPFLGVAYSQAHTKSALAGHADAYSPVASSDAVGEAAEVLARGGVVAWYEGRSEHGSRALGNRSILASPAYDAHRVRINRDVKFREAFRPVAPAVLEDKAAEFFDLAQPSPYMMRIVDCLPGVRDAAPAVIHRDGTARVQTVSADSSLGRIITEFDRLTGLPMVVNTSLNVGSPIVETPGEAAQVFENAPIDLAYVNGFLASKASR